METIKQEKGSKDCLACVAAMATQTTVADFKKYIKENNLPFDSDITFIRYLLDNGYLVGTYFSTNGVSSDVKMSDLHSVDLLRANSYIVVESKNARVKEQGASHAIYWDGENKKIHDPSPEISEPKIRDYKVIECMVIIKNSEHPRWETVPASER